MTPVSTQSLIMTIPPHINRKDLCRHPLCRRSDLDLHLCVHKGGQSFTWHPLNDDDDRSWCNLVDGHLVILGHSSDCDDDDMVYFECIKGMETAVRASLVRYFRLDQDLESMLREWECRDDVFKRLARARGVRVLRIDPWECLVSFICSQNNAINRILTMVHFLQRNFGQLCYNVELSDGAIVPVYAFPTCEAFIEADHHVEVRSSLETLLRDNNFGYRAKYFGPVARRVGTESTLLQFRSQSYDHAIEYLTGLPGVGPKVADCVALYSLDKLEAVPIDTHILRVALSHYMRDTGYTRGKGMTPMVYKRVSRRLREALGEMAGWAQAVLFVSQLNTR